MAFPIGTKAIKELRDRDIGEPENATDFTLGEFTVREQAAVCWNPIYLGNSGLKR